MNKVCVSQLFAPELVVVKEVAIETLNKLAQRRGQRTFFGCAFTIGKTQLRLRITHMQRPDIRHNIAPRCDFNLHAEIGENSGHGSNGFF